MFVRHCWERHVMCITVGNETVYCASNIRTTGSLRFLAIKRVKRNILVKVKTLPRLQGRPLLSWYSLRKCNLRPVERLKSDYLYLRVSKRAKRFVVNPKWKKIVRLRLRLHLTLSITKIRCFFKTNLICFRVPMFCLKLWCLIRIVDFNKL